MNIDDIANAIKAIEQIDPSDSFAYEKAKSAFRSIPVLPVFICDVPKGTVFCRSRTHDSPDLFTSISEIATPPSTVVRHFGRCNKPSQPRFYCSDKRPTSYIELVDEWVRSKSIGDKVYVTVGRWELQHPMLTAIVPRLDPSSGTSAYDQQHRPILDAFLDDREQGTAEAARIFYDFLATTFRHTGDLKTYAVSTAYSNLAFEQAGVAAIAYPSVPFGEQGVNFCIDSTFCNKHNLYLTHVLQNELTVSTNAMSKYSFHETKCLVARRIDMGNGRIEW
ncbi:hypothetical protein [Rhodocaloribacter sp.]